MHLSSLEWLRCPFCGTRLTLVDTSPIVRRGEELTAGVLGCECCAYPVIAGIPVLVADDTTRTAMHQFESGHGDEALLTLLALDDDRRRAFEVQMAAPATMTYRSSLEVLSPDPEGTYFLYRFSDPTYLMAQGLLRAVRRHAPLAAGRAIDLCGGSGHLTRVLLESRTPDDTVLADVFFWKLWLARTFTAPGCAAVCCDANNPLPFAREAFRLVVLSDAFPYIWQKRLLAEEMMRLVQGPGAVVMPHLHSSLGENFSAGMTLTPASYRDLFAPLSPRLFDDARLLDDVLDRGTVDLTAAVAAEELGTAPSLSLVASKDAELFQVYALADVPGVRGELRVNPLYDVRVDGRQSTLTLTFPTEEYAEEFGACRRYLPASVMLPGDVRGALTPARLGRDAERLLRARVILDVPERYY